MAEQSFDDIQAQMQNQMNSQMRGNNLQEVASDLAEATRNLNTTNQQQLMQMQVQMAAQQQQTQAMQQLGMQVQSTTTRQNSIQSPPPSFNQVIQPISNAMSQGASYAAQSAMQGIENLRQGSMRAYQTYGFGMGQDGMGIGGSPGYLSTPDMGMGAGMLHATGLTWRPEMAQNYTFGAYRRAQMRNVGQNAYGYGAGAMASLTGLLSFGTLGGWAGGAIGTAGGGFLGGEVGSAIGETLGGMADVVNPFAAGAREAGKATAWGVQANRGAGSFLRGMGDSMYDPNEFSLKSQAKIGNMMSDRLLNNLTYSQDDILAQQGRFQESGLYLGVQDAEGYVQRTMKLLDTHKATMKTLQVGMKEASDYMAQLYNEIGYDPGAQMNRFTSRMAGVAGAAGISTSAAMAAAGRGAGMAGQFGLYNTAGAEAMLQGRSMASTAATMNMPTDLLASVGGEEGLANIIARAQMKFQSGAAGSVMALGGNFNNGITNGLSMAGGALQTGGDLVSFAANRHSRVSKMRPEEVLAQQGQFIMNAAEQLGGGMGSLEDRMRLVAQGQGMSGMEAEAFINSIKSARNDQIRQRKFKAQNRSDLVLDQMQEQFSFGSQAKRYVRDLAMNTMGGRHVRNAITGAGASLGEYAEGLTERASDYITGIKGRTNFGMDDTIALEKALASGEDVMGVRSGRSTAGYIGFDPAARERATSFFGQDNKTSRLLRAEIGIALKENNPDRLRSIVKTIRANKQIRSRSDIRHSGDMAPVTDEEVMEMMRASGASSEQTKKAAEALGYNFKEPDRMDVMTQEDRLKFGERLGVEAVSSKGKAEIDEALGDVNFQAFAEAIEDAFGLYDPVNQAQSKEYQKKASRAISAYKKLSAKSPKAKKIADGLLQSKGIKIDPSKGTLSFGGLVEKRTKNMGSLKGDDDAIRGAVKAGGAMFGGGVQALRENFKKVKRGRMRSQAAASVKSSLEGMGIYLDEDITESNIDSMRDKITGSLSMMSDEMMEKMVKSGGIHKKLAQVAYGMKHKKMKLNNDQVANVMDMLAMVDIENTEGTQYSTKNKLDPRVMGMESIKQMEKMSDNNAKTAVILRELSSKLNIK